MTVAIRGTTPGVTGGTGDPISLTLNGARQPNTDDVLVIIHSNDFYALSNMPTPTVGGSTTGVNAITDGTADNGTDDAHAKSYTYVVGSTGDLTVAVDETGSADEEKALVVYVLSGVDTTTPIDDAANATGTTPTGGNMIAPSVSPTSEDAFLICHVSTGASTAGAITHPSGMTETVELSNGGGGDVGNAVLQLSASGATGTKTFVAESPHNPHYVGLSIAVKTATEEPGGPTTYAQLRPAVVAP